VDPAKSAGVQPWCGFREELARWLPVEVTADLDRDLPRARALVYLTRSEGLGSGILLAMARGSSRTVHGNPHGAGEHFRLRTGAEPVIFQVLAGLFGLLIGSFLNVCIYRWPRGRSVVCPRSACPECGKPIAWYDNIPVLSYLILRARCRQCGAGISWRYSVVELVTAVTFAYFAGHYGMSPEAVKYCVLSSILIALVFTDLETLLLPDELTLGGCAIGLGFAAFVPVPDMTFHLIASLSGFELSGRTGMLGEALFGAIVPAGSIWLGGWLFEKLRHKQGLGFGDVKMLAMIGAFLGIRGALLTIILASVAGSIVGLAYIKLTGKDAATYQLPFGSFLGAAALAAAIAGQSFIAWYARALG